MDHRSESSGGILSPQPVPSPTVASLAEDVSAGKPRAVARAVSLVENETAEGQDLLRLLYPKRAEALILGITGAPGSGKSTLVDQLIERFRREGRSVGVVAVDPSSPFSGGAILGDRIRMMRHSLDSGVFIRSMATRGHLGGLSKTTGDVLAVFEAAGMTHILVETVGVGQDEVEVVKLADVVLVVLTPGQGDDIQAFKAGLMEIADIFVLNKADAPGADKLEQQLQALLELGAKDRARPPVVKTVAPEGRGIDELIEAVGNFRRSLEPGRKEGRRKRLLSTVLWETIQSRLCDRIRSGLTDREFEACVERIYRRQSDPYTEAERILKRFG